MAKSDDLARIIIGCQQGDEECFSQLVDMYSGRLYGYFYRLTGNRDISDELLRELYVKLVEKIHTFEGRSSLYTWLYRVATNIALEKLQDKHKRYVTSSLDDPVYAEKGNIEPFELADFDKNNLGDEDMQNYLNSVLNEMNEILRTVFVLRDIEGNSTADTAKLLNLSESNVKIRLMRARLFLREKFVSYYNLKGREWRNSNQKKK